MSSSPVLEVELVLSVDFEVSAVLAVLLDLAEDPVAVEAALLPVPVLPAVEEVDAAGVEVLGTALAVEVAAGLGAGFGGGVELPPPTLLVLMRPHPPS
ncbi:MAG: hypothetical protein WC314_19410 [Vulcanimicrobiota bacterium]